MCVGGKVVKYRTSNCSKAFHFIIRFSKSQGDINPEGTVDAATYDRTWWNANVTWNFETVLKSCRKFRFAFNFSVQRPGNCIKYFVHSSS